jgi:hypothetical protein
MTGDEIHYERWNYNAKFVAVKSMDHARRHGHGSIGTWHLLLGFITVQPAIFAQCGLDVAALQEHVETMVGSTDPGPPADGVPEGFPLTADAVASLRSVGRDSPDGVVNQVELLAGFLQEGVGAARVLTDLGVTPERVRAAYQRIYEIITGPGTWGGPGALPPEPLPSPGVANVPPEIREITDRILEARTRKEVAIDAMDFDLAASERDSEKSFVAERAQRVRELAGTIDVLALIEEVEEFRDRVISLRIRAANRGDEDLSPD